MTATPGCPPFSHPQVTCGERGSDHNPPATTVVEVTLTSPHGDVEHTQLLVCGDPKCMDAAIGWGECVGTVEARLLTLDEAEDITGRFLGEVTV